MKKLELSIPGMQSAHCQARVNGAIKDINGVNIEKMEAGKLSFSYDDESEKEELIAAVENAGYKVGDPTTNISSCSTSCCTN